MRQLLHRFQPGKKAILLIYILFAIAASIQSYLAPKKNHAGTGIAYTSYNNYIIFKQSFHHLLDNKDMYVLYPDEHWDLYKYTPTFSLLFGFFAMFPDWAGLLLWNLLNALVLFFAIWFLPQLSSKSKKWISLLVLVELMTSMQNEQSNGLIAGLLLFAVGFMERKKMALAALVILLSAFIKLFGLAGFTLFLFYPGKWKTAVYSMLICIILLALPLLVISSEQYSFLLKSYWNMLSMDHAASYGFSVMGWLHSWFGADPGKNTIVLAGLILFLAPFARIHQYNNSTFRLLALASLLIWLVIFNHKAESATFIIAMSGVAIWFVQSRKTGLDISLLVLAMLFTSLSPTDIFPRSIRNSYVVPYSLKAFPCILIWFKILYEMFTIKNESPGEENVSFASGILKPS